MNIAEKLRTIEENVPKVYESGYNEGFEAGKAEGKTEVVGNFEITENGEYMCTPNAGEVFSMVKVTVDVPTNSDDDGGIETDVTATFNIMSQMQNISTYNTTLLGMASGFDPNFSCYYGYVTIGKKYRVYCTPMNPDNLWSNFLFSTSACSSLVVTANDDEIGKYVKKKDASTFDVYPPDDCEWMHINFKISDGCKICLVE